MGSSGQMARSYRASTVAFDTGDTTWSSSSYSRGYEVAGGSRRTPAIPTYTDALIRSSQRLRERSMSPPAAPPTLEKVSPYKCNMDYYRGKVKSLYEKEPCFKDFVRHIPLSESNMYDMNNLSRIKRRFSSIVQDRWGRDSTPDPLKPSRNTSEVYEPVADKLAVKHKSIPYGSHPLPYIYVYHRSTNTRKY